MATKNIISANVRGLNNDNKCKTIWRWLNNINAKIVFLQETFCTKEIKNFPQNEWIIRYNFSSTPHSKGVAILFHRSLDVEIHNIHKKDDSRVILINATIDNTETTLCNVYAPNDSYTRRDFFNTLKYWIARHTDYENNLILGGDMNCALNNNDRLNNNRGNTDVSRDALHNLIKSLKLSDSWYVCNDTVQYTYFDPKYKSRSRIDYIFISEQIVHKVKFVKLKHTPIKEHHDAICLGYIIKDNKKGKGYWKLNSKLMEYPEYDTLVDNITDECTNGYADFDHTTRWELWKIKIQEGSISLGVHKAKQKNKYIKNLQNRLDQIKKDESNGIDINENDKNALIENIEQFYKEKNDGYLLRSKIKWTNEGERSTKFFFNLEKSRQSSNVIRQLKDEHGALKTLDNEILQIGTKFYDKLFETKNISQQDINDFLNDTEFENVLTERQKLECDEPISEKEITNVIKNLKTEKSPGCDGITPEFYKKYWNKIKHLFMNMIEETYRKGILPYTLRKAIVALLYKKGDKTLLKNYRPISLTNYDYKIICFALANRLQKVLQDIIHPDQTGYIKKRYIGTNARLLIDYFEHCENKQIPGILLYLDFEKAFDSVEWNFMTSTLEKFNFGKNFINWVKILYNKPTISIKNNGWLSSDIELSRGVRQGCPLSALLFVLTVEVMAIRIRNNNNIHGFQCQENNIKQSMYADDTTLLLNDVGSLDHAIDTVKKFSAVAGPILNVDKTEGMLLGPLKNTMQHYRGIVFTNEAIRCLGVYMGHDKNMCYQLNWSKKLEKIKLILERWKNRNLTIFGKNLIIKSLAVSQLIHTMSIIHTPPEILREVEKTIFNFLWNSHDRIKRKTLIGPKDSGGIEMLDIYCKDFALKAGWARRLHYKNCNSDFVNMILNKVGLNCEYLLKCSVTDRSYLANMLNLSDFWVNVFASILECKTAKDIALLNSSEFLAEPI